MNRFEHDDGQQCCRADCSCDSDELPAEPRDAAQVLTAIVVGLCILGAIASCIFGGRP